MEDRTIIMSSEIQVVTRINKRTTAAFFKDLKVNSRLIFSVPLQAAGVSRGRSYATYVKVTDYDTRVFTHCSFNQMAKILKNFELHTVMGK